MNLVRATEITDGLYPDLPMSEYMGLRRYGSSSLRAMRAGPPAMVPWLRDHPTEDTPDTILGTAAHCAILEPKRFRTAYSFKPQDAPDRPTEAMRNAKNPSESSVARVRWWDAFERENAGKTILPFATWEQVEDIVEAFHAKASAHDSLDGAGVEQTCLWTCPETGLSMKARPDWYDDEAVYDLKVSRHATKASSLAYRAFMEGWMHQLAHHRLGLHEVGLTGIRYGRLVVIAPKPPQSLRVYCLEVKESALDVLAMENEATRKKMAECEKAHFWPGSPDEFTKVDLPPGALMEIAGVVDMSGAEEV